MVNAEHWKFDPTLLWHLVTLSGTAVLQFLIATLSWSGLVMIVAAFGSVAIAGYQIGLRVIIFVILPAVGLANAAATLVGQNLGAGKPAFDGLADLGLARQGGRACIVSLARTDPSFYGLPPDPDLRDERAVAEVLHEMGHLATLEHCPDRGCLMSFAGNVERVDTRGGRFCPACRERLPSWLSRPA